MLPIYNSLYIVLTYKEIEFVWPPSLRDAKHVDYCSDDIKCSADSPQMIIEIG